MRFISPRDTHHPLVCPQNAFHFNRDRYNHPLREPNNAFHFTPRQTHPPICSPPATRLSRYSDGQLAAFPKQEPWFFDSLTET